MNRVEHKFQTRSKLYNYTARMFSQQAPKLIRPHKTNLTDLPDEVFMLVFSFIVHTRTQLQLLPCRLVCLQWFNLCMDPSLGLGEMFHKASIAVGLAKRQIDFVVKKNECLDAATAQYQQFN